MANELQIGSNIGNWWLEHESSSIRGGVFTDPNLPSMGLGLSSQAIHWNQTHFDENIEGSRFDTMLQESSRWNFQQDHDHVDQWRQKSQTDSSDNSSVDDCNQNNNHGFSLDHHNYQEGLFQMNYSTANYGNIPTMLQGLLAYDDPSSYGNINTNNNTHSWNINSNSAAINDASSSWFPSLQAQVVSTPTSEDKTKPKSEVRERVKKTNSAASNKRPRSENPSSLPVSKVKKEKMGDRITALQQLVSPFGKTDTASVLSEAIEYIKYLHDQVTVLITPYMTSGAQFPQNFDKSNKDREGPKIKDLRSRGLCFVPISSTFPFTHETTVDFWTPTFRGIFR